MEDAVVLEPASLSSARDIAELSRVCVEDGLGWRYRAATIVRYIRNPEVEVVVSRHEGRLAGFVISEFHEEHVHLVLLAVGPDYRRSGMGRMLIEWIERMALDAGIFRMVLEVRAGRPDARAFYEAIGYRFVKRLKGYHLGREDALRMERNLAIS
jgi:ribosomal protein S18 acetylase RimI-like enzyme